LNRQVARKEKFMMFPLVNEVPAAKGGKGSTQRGKPGE